MDTTTTRMSGLLDELERENARLTRENGILAAKNAAQSDMLREAVKAAAEWQSERDALKQFYELAHNFDLTSDMYSIALKQGGDVFVECVVIMAELANRGYAHIEQILPVDNNHA